jgi:hypothetical protein
MSETLIYGASDDLLEIEGQLSEELNPSSDEKNLLALSDGTLLEIWYDEDGIWRIRTLVKGACEQRFEQGSVADDEPDKLTLIGDLRWCMLGERGQFNPVMARAKSA